MYLFTQEEESILGRWYFYDSYRRDRDDWVNMSIFVDVHI